MTVLPRFVSWRSAPRALEPFALQRLVGADANRLVRWRNAHEHDGSRAKARNAML